MTCENVGPINGQLDNLTPTERRMATENIRSLVFNYSLPTVIGMMVNALYNIVGRFWIGQIEGEVGALAYTGVGLMIPISNVILAFAQLVGIGAASNISIKLGQNDKKGAEEILNNAFVLSIVLSILISIFGYIYAPQILMLSGASERTLPYALSYGRIIIGGCIFQVVSFSMNHCIRATGNPKRFASTQLLGGVINIILVPIFIFSLGFGPDGAAIATVISQFISAVWVFSYYFGKKAPLKFYRKFMKINPKTVMIIFSIGLSPFLMQVSNSVVNTILNNSRKFYGEMQFGDGDLAVGAMTLINTMSIFFITPIIGINQGVQPIVGFNYGRKDYRRAKSAFLWSVVYSTALCVFGWTMIQLLPEQLALIFNKNEAINMIASRGMRFFLLCLPVIGFQSCSANFFQAIGRAQLSILLNASRQLMILTPLALILPRFLGIDGIWYSGAIADFTAFLISAVIIMRELKIINRKIEIEDNLIGLEK